jgi:hypothetical protein
MRIYMYESPSSFPLHTCPSVTDEAEEDKSERVDMTLQCTQNTQSVIKKR